MDADLLLHRFPLVMVIQNWTMTIVLLAGLKPRASESILDFAHGLSVESCTVQPAFAR